MRRRGPALLQLIEPEAITLQVLRILGLNGVQLTVRRTVQIVTQVSTSIHMPIKSHASENGMHNDYLAVKRGALKNSLKRSSAPKADLASTSK